MLKAMTSDELFQKVAIEKPTTLYLGGKTATGKSTFAQKLQAELGFGHVGLEDILMDLIAEHRWNQQQTFLAVFRQSEPSKEKELFLRTVAETIAQCRRRYSQVVIEGALGNSRTLLQILQGVSDFTFVYFHPAKLEPYIRNLTARFKTARDTPYAGLPKTFWDFIDPIALEHYVVSEELTEDIADAIAGFAQYSQRESMQRLNEYRKLFGAILVVDVN